MFADEMGMLGSHGDSSTILVIPSRLQVFLGRELFGWPLYGIILAFGQVSFPLAFPSGRVVTINHLTDFERDRLPNRLAFWIQRGDECRSVYHWRGVLQCLCRLVPLQAIHLGSFPSLVLLQRRLPPHQTSLHQQYFGPCTRHPLQYCDLVIFRGIRRWFRPLWSQLW